MTECRFCEEPISPGEKSCGKCGADIPEEDFQPLTASGNSLEEIADPFEREVIDELVSSGKIAAIKLHRERTSSGLKEAKEAVEALARKYEIQSVAGGGCASVLLLGLVYLSVIVGFVMIFN